MLLQSRDSGGMKSSSRWRDEQMKTDGPGSVQQVGVNHDGSIHSPAAPRAGSSLTGKEEKKLKSHTHTHTHLDLFPFLLNQQGRTFPRFHFSLFPSWALAPGTLLLGEQEVTLVAGSSLHSFIHPFLIISFSCSSCSTDAWPQNILNYLYMSNFVL